MTTYAKGTRLGDVPEFDRSTHIKFYCPSHFETVWISKDPFVSRWFPDVAPGEDYQTCRQYPGCAVPLVGYLIAEDYTPFAVDRSPSWD